MIEHAPFTTPLLFQDICSHENIKDLYYSQVKVRKNPKVHCVFLDAGDISITALDRVSVGDLKIQGENEMEPKDSFNFLQNSHFKGK